MSSSSLSEVRSSSAGDGETAPSAGRFGSVVRWLFEVGVITAVFAAAGSWPVPDTNEAHYLTKARHAADPSWCSSDFFLSTGDAHTVFFQLVGPLAAVRPLDEVAWIGRVLGWLLLAVGMRQVAAVILDREPGSGGWRGTWWHILAAALFSLLVRVTPASGEWVIGGFESKVFAWAGVLLAAAAVAAGRFGWAFVASGAATAVHPVVGGWGLGGVMCVGLWRLAIGISRGIRGEPVPDGEPGGNGQLLRGLLGLLVGGGLAAVGVLPALALSRGVDPAVVAEAARIQVVERLPHHLLPERFQQTHVVAHVLTIALALVAWAAARPSRRAGRLMGLAAVAVLISACGLVIAAVRPNAPAVADQLLRFYWFRFADGLVPLAAAVMVVDWLRWGRTDEEAPSPQRAAAVTAAVVVLLVAVAWNLVDEHRHWPTAVDPPASRGDKHVDAEPWRDLCDWIRDNTPEDAVFLTPRGAATFTWRTSRAEVVSWKNMPQDPESVVAWRQRIFDLYSPAENESLSNLERSTAALGEDRVQQMAARYGADFIIVPQKTLDQLGEPLPASERVHANEGYVLYRVSEADRPASPPSTASEPGTAPSTASEG